MDLIVSADGMARFAGQMVPCRLGRAGLVAVKREGDGASPIGAWPLRGLFYRPDRLPPPVTALACRALDPDDGWCDDAADPFYNRPVRLPYPARCEHLWRDDGVYDLIVPLGYNDDPVIAGAGSAIFLHLARPDGGPTEGCVALDLPALLTFLACATATSRVVILG